MESGRAEKKSVAPTFKAGWQLLRGVDKKWLAIWMMIYASFIGLELFIPKAYEEIRIIKYSGIFLCLVYAWAKYKNDSKLVMAMGLTLLSDTILMFTGAKVVGIYVFCFAQIMHTLRLSGTPNIYLGVHFLVQFLIFAFCIMQDIEPIYTVAFLYAINIFSNLHLAHKWHKKEPASISASCCFWGMWLFIACDVCCAITFLGETGVISGAISAVAAFLVFVFYYPSQVLLSNSSTLPANSR